MSLENVSVIIKIASTRGLGIVVSILRLKIVALLLGPTGIVILSNLNLLVMNVKTLAGLGIQTSFVRKIAQANDDPEKQEALIRFVLSAHILQTLPAAVIFLSASGVIATHVLHAPDLQWMIAALTLAIIIEMLALVAAAAFIGTRRTVQFAQITLISAAFATIVGCVSVYCFGKAGVLGFVIAQPTALVFLSCVGWGRISELRPQLFNVSWSLYRNAFKSGVQLMLSTVMMPMGLLVALSIMINARGSELAGLYAAAVAIATQYVGTFIAAIGADFYPQLSAEMAVGRDRRKASQLIVEHTRISLALFAGPLLVFMISAEWLLQLLFSNSFVEAAALLKGLILANLIKLAFTPIGFSVVAGGFHGTFLWRNLVSVTVFVVVAYLTFDVGPLEIAALAFILQHSANALMSVYVAKNRCEVSIPIRLWLEIFIILCLGGLVFFVTRIFTIQSIFISMVGLLFVAVWSIWTLYDSRAKKRPQG